MGDFSGLSVQKAIDDGMLRVVYQPILDMLTNKVFGFEALVRCQTPGLENPLVLFEAAIDQGVCGILGREIRKLSVANCQHTLFLNVNPHEFAEGWLVRPDDPIFEHEHDIYLEITESVPLSHFEACAGVLRELRSKGMKLAVDDLGAGYSNLKYISDLEPDVVKLDRELVSDIQANPRLRRLVFHMVELCEDLGARVVAEGIETEAELGVAREVGVHFGQGYLIARPAFPPPAVMKFGLDPPPGEA